ncbi:hypothetical protein [Actinomadura decatromicini]|uniref:Signal peptidase I n=1 Tax=Actinomadura decatromicini TaxID=2604572 RepID=A0A5D3FAK8_9ACTN|nr:hypothetical protein [Actinomadura decatromicini]TYK45119.1 hypothetical protein FXF68_31030 [Actinomadura decatromicini]
MEAFLLPAGTSPTDKQIVVNGRFLDNLGPVGDGHHAETGDWYLFLGADNYWKSAQVVQVRDHGHQVRFMGARQWMPVRGMTALREPPR